jgi:hypothetical protein
MKLSETQRLFINQGALSRKRLRNTAERALTNGGNYYFYSPPGLGKTYTIEQVAENMGIDLIDIKGNASMWAFTVQIALIVRYLDPKEHAYVFIDDCDTLLTQVDSVNTMKIALNDKKLTYNKSLGAQFAQLSEQEQEAIESFKTPEGKVEIPLKNMTIIWASNYKLADQSDTANAKSDRIRQKYIDEEALRRRMTVRDYDVEGDILWGWIADCVLNETPPNMQDATEEQKNDILYWMHANWNNLKEHNISFAEKLFEEMEIDPDGYATTWELDYLVN